jgi:hypothetical protein
MPRQTRDAPSVPPFPGAWASIASGNCGLYGGGPTTAPPLIPDRRHAADLEGLRDLQAPERHLLKRGLARLAHMQGASDSRINNSH